MSEGKNASLEIAEVNQAGATEADRRNVRDDCGVRLFTVALCLVVLFLSFGIPLLVLSSRFHDLSTGWNRCGNCTVVAFNSGGAPNVALYDTLIESMGNN